MNVNHKGLTRDKVFGKIGVNTFFKRFLRHMLATQKAKPMLPLTMKSEPLIQGPGIKWPPPNLGEEFLARASWLT